MIPDWTTVVAVDEEHADELELVWPTWRRNRPELLQRPLLIFCDGERSTDFWERRLAFVDHPETRHVSWMLPDVSQREKMLTSLVLGAAQHVETQWYLKLDTDVVALSHDDWVKPSWFRPNEAGQEPVFVTNPWPYSKPADVMDRLDRWGNAIEGLNHRPPLRLPRDTNSCLVPHRRIISWCFFANADWTRAMAELAPHRLPVPSQDSFLWYCAKRRGDYYRTVRMSKFGWRHVGRRSLLKYLCKMHGNPHELMPSQYPDHAIELIRLLNSRRVRPRCGAEIGVYRGDTSAALLNTFDTLTLYMIDRWRAADPESQYVQSGDQRARASALEQARCKRVALRATRRHRDRRSAMQMDSSAAAKQVSDSSLDFVFIDGDHTFSAVARDLAVWWDKVKPGGLLCGHDYGHPRDRRGVWGVSRAVDAFAARVRQSVEVGAATVWSIAKP